MEDTFEDLLQTIERNALDNKMKINNVELFVKSWRKERELTLTIPVVVKPLPTEQCVKDWWGEGINDEYFWKKETNWSNEQVFRKIYQAITYFINKWQ